MCLNNLKTKTTDQRTRKITPLDPSLFFDTTVTVEGSYDVIN